MHKEEHDTIEQETELGMDMFSDSESYLKGFLKLRNAIIDNCKGCIVDCGKDCLDLAAQPIEDIRCPLQKVRIDFGIAINTNEESFPA